MQARTISPHKPMWAGSYGTLSLDADGQWPTAPITAKVPFSSSRRAKPSPTASPLPAPMALTMQSQVTLTGSNDAPVLTAQSQSVTEDGAKLTGQMVVTDVDTGDTLSFSLANRVDGFTLNTDGSYSFDPASCGLPTSSPRPD
ncbi:hypothetical protein HT094_01090 [Shewanella sp. ZOR0012]|nr:hypothetical protein [Shewanella sp. ZOR0012]